MCAKKNKVTRRDFLKGATSGIAGVALSAITTTTTLAKTPETYKIVLGTSFTKPQEKWQVLNEYKWKELIEKRTDGDVVVEIHGGGEFGSQIEMPKKVRDNIIQACNVSTQNLAANIPVYNVLDFPYLFSNVYEFVHVLASDWFDKVLHEKVRARGFEVAYYQPHWFRVLGLGPGAPKPVRLPKDLEGLKIRVTGSKIEMKAFDVLPSSPTHVAWPETYSALAEGVVDGVHVGAAPIRAFSIDEAYEYATKTHFMTDTTVTIMNKEWFEELPEEYQKVIKDASRRAMFDYQLETQEKAIKNIFQKWWEEKFNIKIVELTDKELEAWRGQLHHSLPIWDQLKEEYGLDVYKAIADHVG